MDAAVTARLIDVEPVQRRGGGVEPSSDKAKFTYRILRVYKGSRRYNLREGEKLRLENSTDGGSCGLPSKEGKRYGLMLDEFRGELNTSSCGVRSPEQLRRAAQRSGNARSASAPCGSG